MVVVYTSKPKANQFDSISERHHQDIIDRTLQPSSVERDRVVINHTLSMSESRLTLAYYCSGHGFGHATRYAICCSISNARPTSLQLLPAEFPRSQPVFCLSILLQSFISYHLHQNMYSQTLWLPVRDIATRTLIQ